MIINVENLNLREIKDPLARQIIILLLTEAYVEPDELPSGVTSNRGCWMDKTEFTIANRKKKINLGSKLWLLQEQPLTDESPELARQYAKEALDILVESGELKKLDILAECNGNRLNLQVNYNGQILTLKGL